MTPLRQRMIDDMTVRGLAENTIKSYLGAVTGLTRHYRRSPGRMALRVDQGKGSKDRYAPLAPAAGVTVRLLASKTSGALAVPGPMCRPVPEPPRPRTHLHARQGAGRYRGSATRRGSMTPETLQRRAKAPRVEYRAVNVPRRYGIADLVELEALLAPAVGNLRRAGQQSVHVDRTVVA